MNYIDLLNHFWKINKEFSFTPNEKAVYFALLYKWNDLHRKNPFNQSTETLASDSGVSESTVQRSRKILKEVGLISFQAGDGRKKNTVYTIHDLTKGSQTEHLSKNKGSHKESLSPNKGSQEGSHSEHLYDEKEQIKVVTVTDNIDKSIEEKDANVKNGEEGGVREEIRSQNLPVPIGNSSVYSSMDDVEIICLTQSTIWLENMTRRLSLKNLESAKNWVREFFEEQRAAGQDKRDLQDAKSHCYSWVKIQIGKNTGEVPKGKAEAALELHTASADYWEMQKQAHINNQNNQ
jgi:DNA-binding MarR family transcriptional regulator